MKDNIGHFYSQHSNRKNLVKKEKDELRLATIVEHYILRTNDGRKSAGVIVLFFFTSL